VEVDTEVVAMEAAAGHQAMANHLLDRAADMEDGQAAVAHLMEDREADSVDQAAVGLNQCLQAGRQEVDHHMDRAAADLVDGQAAVARLMEVDQAVGLSQFPQAGLQEAVPLTDQAVAVMVGGRAAADPLMEADSVDRAEDGPSQSHRDGHQVALHRTEAAAQAQEAGGRHCVTASHSLSIPHCNKVRR
jgi:hypothetical protein